MNRTKLYRSSDDAVIFGVCGGIAEYLDLAPWGVRLVWVLLTLAGFPFTVIAYVALALLLKRKPRELSRASGPPPLWSECPATHSELLARVQRRFEMLDSRLQRMESIVTNPAFDLEQKYRNL
jgi:phage shock protein C